MLNRFQECSDLDTLSHSAEHRLYFPLIINLYQFAGLSFPSQGLRGSDMQNTTIQDFDKISVTVNLKQNIYF